MKPSSRTVPASLHALTSTFALLFGATAYAGVIVWDGGGTNLNWSTPENWVGDVAPQSGDALVFAAGGTFRAARNDFTNFVVGGITINSDTPVTAIAPLSNANRAITLTGDLVNNRFPSQLVSLDITLGKSVTWSSPGAGTFNVGGQHDLNGFTLTLEPSVTILGNLGGTGALVTKGPFSGSTVTISNDNTYQGLTTVQSGILSVSKPSALGSTLQGTEVLAGAALNINATNVGAESVTLNGSSAQASLTGTGTGSLAGDVSLLGSLVKVGGEGTLTLNGIVSGSSVLAKEDQGTIALAGANTFTGRTEVRDGTLRVDNSQGLGATANGTTVLSGGTLLIATTGVVEPVTLFSSLASTEHPVLAGTGTASLLGNVNVIGAATREISARPGSTFTILGTIDDTGSVLTSAFTKTGSGTLVLAGSNTFTGSVVVDSGILRVTNALGLGSASGQTIVSSGALELADVSIADETVRLGNVFGTSSSGIIGSGDSSFLGNLVLATSAAYARADGDLTIGGTISEDGSSRGLRKIGAGTLRLDGDNTYTGLTNVQAGTLVVNGSVLGDVSLAANTVLGGAGNIGGNVINEGTVAPGNSPGTLTVDGDYTQISTAQLLIELGGAGSGEFDVLNILGDAFLGGGLDVSLWNGFIPDIGDSFDFLLAQAIQGTFDSVLLPVFTDRQLNLDYGLDYVRLTVVGTGPVSVPEPSVLALFSVGLLVIGFAGRRRRWGRGPI